MSSMLLRPRSILPAWLPHHRLWRRQGADPAGRARVEVGLHRAAHQPSGRTADHPPVQVTVQDASGKHGDQRD